MTQSDTRKEMPVHDWEWLKRCEQLFEDENWRWGLQRDSEPGAGDGIETALFGQNSFTQQTG